MKNISNKHMTNKKKLLFNELVDLGAKIRKLQNEYEKKLRRIHKIEDKIYISNKKK